MKVVDSINAFETLGMLGDPRRVAILRFLIREPATLTQLGQAFEMHPAKIRYHLKQLEAAGLVELVLKREVRGFVEKYYRATAGAYFINQILLPAPGPAGSIYIIGSHDPALEMLAEVMRSNPSLPNLVVIPVGSLNGLISLRQGFCQVAGCHLLDPVGGEYNLSYVRHFFPGQPMHIVTLAHRRQGLVVAAGNPLHIRGINDLVREDVTLINRKTGSGTRIWLDHELQISGISQRVVRGYQLEVNTHSQVAEAVVSQKADVGLAVQAAAIRYNLDFIPLFEERFDLVIPEQNFKSDLLKPLLNYLQTAQFRKSLASLGGYNPLDTGREIQL